MKISWVKTHYLGVKIGVVYNVHESGKGSKNTVFSRVFRPGEKGVVFTLF